MNNKGCREWVIDSEPILLRPITIRTLADFFHMAHTGDGPAELRAAMDTVVFAEIAEKEGRAYPGTHGDDFRPWFRAMRDGGYHGLIGIEGSGEDAMIANAIREIERQAADI